MLLRYTVSPESPSANGFIRMISATPVTARRSGSAARHRHAPRFERAHTDRSQRRHAALAPRCPVTPFLSALRLEVITAAGGFPAD